VNTAVNIRVACTLLRVVRLVMLRSVGIGRDVKGSLVIQLDVLTRYLTGMPEENCDKLGGSRYRDRCTPLMQGRTITYLLRHLALNSQKYTNG
jgi:hypothetical protein